MKTLFAALLLGIAGTAWAQATPAGLWKTIDDDTKAEKSLVRITDNGGVLSGKVEKILSDKPDAKCTECTDERKGQLVQGMTILRDIKQDLADKALWIGGDILDPNNGKIYKAKAKLVDGGRKLDLRGFVGVALLGRTQTWLREQ